jgi:4-hydroxy-tetrahydrodipicolinate synthase
VDEFAPERLRGMHAATIVPMRADFSIDEAALAGHLAQIADTPGIHGLLINGHAGENFVLDAHEKRRVVEIARQVVPNDRLLCSGVNAESSLAAAEEARTAEVAGADILLLFQPNSFALSHDPQAALIHHQHVLAATSLPLMLYSAPVSAGALAYDAATLRVLTADPRVIGTKEGSWEVATYEANRRLLKSLRPDFVVLGSGDEHLLTSYLIGSEGSQVSLAAIAPELCADFYAAASTGDWVAARRLHDRIYPLAVAIYRDPPGGRATTRLKACLVLLGKLTAAHVRPPQPPVTRAEWASLKSALILAELLPA